MISHGSNAQHIRQTLSCKWNLRVGARLVALLLARLVADRRPDLDLVADGRFAAHRAHDHTQATLLQDVHVVVVRVAHRPAGRVLLHVLIGGRVHPATVAVRPVGEHVQIVGVHLRHNRIVDVPVGGSHGGI